MLSLQNTPTQALNKSLATLPIVRDKIQKLQTELNTFLSHLNHSESEEHNKNLIADLLKNIGFAPEYFVNTKGRNDLVIHTSKDSSSSVGVIIEAKSLVNKAEMPTQEKLNSKALQELVLYFLRERITVKNLNLKYLIITNGLDWFVFDAQVFEKYFGQKKALLKDFEDFENKLLSGKDTSFFYKEIAQKYVLECEAELEFTYFNLKDFETDLNWESDKNPSKKLIALTKYLSPTNLLKLPFANDSNTLNRGFYTELLHIIGLEEVKDGGKKLIQRKSESNRESGSFLENAIAQIEQQDNLYRLSNRADYGETKAEQTFGVALELCITWINRILFLKLLEAQLISYNDNPEIKRGFLNSAYLSDLDELNNLFFGVLAKTTDQRSPENQQKYTFVPYLNSSLFELTELEHSIFSISQLRDGLEISILQSTVLRDLQGKKRSGKLAGLDYLLQFLDSFAFGSTGGEEVLETEKSLINSAVLGLIFEKINGYKDGSFFTPGFITSYMAKESIQKAVIQKFNQWYKLDLENFEELKNYVGSPYKKEILKEYNLLVNSLKIVDPAVGSGHFLVSSLNEIIALKSELNILVDNEFSVLSKIKVEVLNDELNIFYTQTGEKFEYKPQNSESAKIQETLFHEKQTLIENCLFGVDINPNSVKICRLRLWIELLKNAYYKSDKQLQTLPNIDINIKCGNSLISRFDLSTDLKNVIKSKKWTIETYKLAVSSYQNASTKEEKRELERLINEIKADFRTYISEQDPMYMEKAKLESELFVEQMSVFGLSEKEENTKKERSEKLNARLKLIESKIEEIKDSRIYHNAFEWRFEFPEVLGENGEFIGFDVVIGNPPYFNIQTLGANSSFANYLKNTSEIWMDKSDILFYFITKAYELSSKQVSFIVSNAFLFSDKAQKLRNFIVSKLPITKLINFEKFQVFDEASITSMMIFMDKKSQESQTLVQNFTNLNYEIDYLNGSFTTEKNYYNVKLNEDSVFALIDNKTQDFTSKIDGKHPKLGEILKVGKGMETAANEVFAFSDYLSEFPDNFIKKRMSGEIIQKYTHVDAIEYLLYFEDQKDFELLPNSIKDHLEKHREKLENRATVKNEGRGWWKYSRPMHKEYYHLSKIWCSYRGKDNCFCLDETNDFIGLTNTTVIFGNNEDYDLKYILGLLNSKLLNYRYKSIGKQTGSGVFEYFENQISKLPIPTLDTDEKKDIASQIEALVTQILEMKKENLDTHDLEAQIDTLVYELYGLDEAEIQLVEGK